MHKHILLVIKQVCQMLDLPNKLGIPGIDFQSCKNGMHVDIYVHESTVNVPFINRNKPSIVMICICLI